MKLGVIGYGARISWIVELIRKQAPDCSVAAIVDVRKEAIKRSIRGQQVVSGLSVQKLIRIS